MDSLSQKFQSIAIYTHHKPEKAKDEVVFLNELLKFFKKHGVKVVSGDVRTVSLLGQSISLIDDQKPYDLKIGIGGDGMLLKMARTLHKDDGFFVGVNFGTLGFLSELSPGNALKDFDRIFRGEFHVDERRLLKVVAWRTNQSGKKEKIFQGQALNEVAFGSGGMARLTHFYVKVARRVLSMYRSDGLIFATPTGSTAYSLSVGGPIISPEISSILVTPIAPHTLSHRPIVLPHDKVIHVRFEERGGTISMTIDGQVHTSLHSSDEVNIQSLDCTARFIRLKESHYFKTLRNKLSWGEKR